MLYFWQDNNGEFNPLVPKAQNSECQNILFPLHIKPVKVSYSYFANIYF